MKFWRRPRPIRVESPLGPGLINYRRTLREQSEADMDLCTCALEPKWCPAHSVTPAEAEHRQWHSDLGRWVEPDEPEYERGWDA